MLPLTRSPRAWTHAVAGTAEAPIDVRPQRIAVCTTVSELTGADPKHDGIGLEWFADEQHLERFESWIRTPDGQSSLTGIGLVVDPEASPVIHAEETILRGADWLEQRWRDGGVKLKHMAIARRAAGLTPAEFSERWRNHAGQLNRSGNTPAIVIPDEARGCAYVQNHPLAHDGRVALRRAERGLVRRRGGTAGPHRVVPREPARR